MNLIIVESPTKAKTISKFLGKDYDVESSYGHIRDLPKSKLGIDIEHDFEPEYIVPMKAKKRVNQLKKDAVKADTVILASDEDREGEAIAWHLIQALGLEEPKIKRIVFHEITESAIKEALKNPRQVDMNLVAAQQARRVLDRLVGYKLSPFLWKKLMRGLSAGRVQSVALRLIVDRENEIKNFKPEEYWTIVASLLKTENLKPKTKNIEANLVKIDDKNLEKFDINNKEKADKIAEDLKNCEFKVSNIEKKEVRKNPPAPFTTSTLQQTASKRLGFSAKKTMMFAQDLYEKGLITYMRTDSLNLSKESVEAAKDWINKELGSEYAVSAPRFFKAKSRLAQEAHEAIRPTDVFKTPEKIKFKYERQEELYKLIWQRFLGSQMSQAIFDSTSVDINAKSKKTNYGLRTNGSTLKFDGFLKIWPQVFEEKELPPLEKDEKLDLQEVKPEQHFTEPPPRYSEATLIKMLEEYGIGRPSTYAPTISVIQSRNYVTKEKGRFFPTEVGGMVNKILVENFPQIVDVNFTAEMEEDLDKIAEGKIKWQKPIEKFYQPFEELLKTKYEEVKKEDYIKEEVGEEKCEKCGKPMVYKYGRFGKFLACSGFPECKNAKRTKKEPPKTIGLKCPKCKTGEIIERRVNRGRARGKIFWGCSTWPKCDYASWTNPLNLPEKTESKEEKIPSLAIPLEEDRRLP